MQASPEAFAGSHIRLVEEEVSKRVDMHINMLLQSAEDCKDEGVIYALHSVDCCFILNKCYYLWQLPC